MTYKPTIEDFAREARASKDVLAQYRAWQPVVLLPGSDTGARKPETSLSRFLRSVGVKVPGSPS
jgi:hypothetical protein